MSPAVGTRNKETRVKWLEKTLAKLPAGTRILDAGAGQQQYRPLCSHLNYVSQDFGKYDGSGDGRGLQKDQQWSQQGLNIVSDIMSIPEPDASFDAILCAEVLEHLPEPLGALKELDRLLKPRGHLILTAPFSSLSHFTPYYFYSGFSEYFYRHALGSYEIIEAEHNGNFYEWLAQEIRRIPDVTRKYGDGKVPFYFKFAERLMLKLLSSLSERDRNSRELLSFGIHVLARKKIK